MVFLVSCSITFNTRPVAVKHLRLVGIVLQHRGTPHCPQTLPWHLMIWTPPHDLNSTASSVFDAWFDASRTTASLHAQVSLIIPRRKIRETTFHYSKCWCLRGLWPKVESPRRSRLGDQRNSQSPSIRSEKLRVHLLTKWRNNIRYNFQIPSKE